MQYTIHVSSAYQYIDKTSSEDFNKFLHQLGSKREVFVTVIK